METKENFRDLVDDSEWQSANEPDERDLGSNRHFDVYFVRASLFVDAALGDFSPLSRIGSHRRLVSFRHCDRGCTGGLHRPLARIQAPSPITRSLVGLDRGRGDEPGPRDQSPQFHLRVGFDDYRRHQFKLCAFFKFARHPALPRLKSAEDVNGRRFGIEFTLAPGNFKFARHHRGSSLRQTEAHFRRPFV